VLFTLRPILHTSQSLATCEQIENTDKMTLLDKKYLCNYLYLIG